MAVGGVLDIRSVPNRGPGPSTVKLSSPPKKSFLEAAGLVSWLELAAVAMVAENQHALVKTPPYTNLRLSLAGTGSKS